MGIDDDAVTPPRRNIYGQYDKRNHDLTNHEWKLLKQSEKQKKIQNANHQSTTASSSIATYMSEENKRFSQLLQLLSSSSRSNPIVTNHLTQIKSDLMSLGRSCQMVGENAHLLHNEASTFIT